MLQRNEKGQFVQTTKTQEYKQKQVNGKQIGEHRIIWENTFGKIPEGLIIHHLDCNKKNNDINNLCLMTITAHNRVHSHKPWNKGIKAATNKKWGEAIKKAQNNRFLTYLPKFKEALELQTKGKTLREIAVIQGTSRRQVSERIKRYKDYIKYNN